MILNDDCIIPAIAGRLGNNMFMIANAYARSLDFNKQLVVEKNKVMHECDYSENVFRKIDFIDNLYDYKKYDYNGYFQSEKYFEKYIENIKSLFGPTNDFIKKIENEIPIIFSKIITVINVRRGDYLFYPNYHPTISSEYINESVKLINNTDIYLIVSDDIEWCKNNIKLENSIYLEGYKTYEQLWIMSMCHNFIISNSSFSWWGAYLSRRKNKIVISPETWFGPEGPKIWDDIYANGWIILPTYFDNGFIYPK